MEIYRRFRPEDIDELRYPKMFQLSKLLGIKKERVPHIVASALNEGLEEAGVELLTVH